MAPSLGQSRRAGASPLRSCQPGHRRPRSANEDVVAAVLGPGGIVMSRILGPFTAVADVVDSSRGNAQLLQVLGGGLGAAVTQREVVLGCAAFIAVSFD